MKETKIFVDTSHGRVLHGTLTGSVFQRRFANNGVRYSDKTLPINPQCIGQLFALGCEVLEYTVDYMGSTIKYTIPFLLNLKEKYGIETNEQGDRDIRIPLEDWNQEVIEMKPISSRSGFQEVKTPGKMLGAIEYQGSLFVSTEEGIFNYKDGGFSKLEPIFSKKKSKSKKIDRCPY